MEGYCLKCRFKREMSNTQAITMKNGRPAAELLQLVAAWFPVDLPVGGKV